jgi:striatin 1/3/4
MSMMTFPLGKMIHGTVAHVEGISTLAIDPNGLYLLSGSHDGSLRLWNMEKKVCLQEIAAHRKKHDMSVLSVAFHPSRPLIGSAGADSLAKVYTSERSQYAGGNNSFVE